MSTYTIETYTDGRWTADGIGESTGWTSARLAIRAMESLASLDDELLARYRARSRQAVHAAARAAATTGGIIGDQEGYICTRGR